VEKTWSPFLRREISPLRVSKNICDSVGSRNGSNGTPIYPHLFWLDNIFKIIFVRKVFKKLSWLRFDNSSTFYYFILSPNLNIVVINFTEQFQRRQWVYSAFSFSTSVHWAMMQPYCNELLFSALGLLSLLNTVHVLLKVLSGHSNLGAWLLTWLILSGIINWSLARFF
jgi:hypothetical protein